MNPPPNTVDQRSMIRDSIRLSISVFRGLHQNLCKYNLLDCDFKKKKKNPRPGNLRFSINTP